MTDFQLTPQVNVDELQNIAQSFTIETAEQFSVADKQLGEVKSRRKQIIEFFAEPKQKAHEAWKSIVAREKFFTDKLDAVELLIKRKMLGWTQEQERICAAEQNRLRAEAETKAEAERKKILAQAKRNETRGNDEKAQEYRKKAAIVKAAPVFVPVVAPKVNGLSTRKIWRVEVTDKAAFVKAAANNPALQAFIEIDTSGLKSFAGKTEIAGIRFYQEETLTKKAA